MKKNIILYLVCLLIVANNLFAQVSTNFNNTTRISVTGKFEKVYEQKIDLEIPSKNIEALLETERLEKLQSADTKPLKIATPVSIDVNLIKLINWTSDNEFAYGKYTIRLISALSASINFDEFHLPKGTEMYVYNENGEMITGPVTDNENNQNSTWGSWVYRGELITIEIKTPIVTKNDLVLHSNNVAYGYKEIYKSIKAGGFGQSGSCNINVICPLGIGWEGERNSVSTMLSANGGEFCTGSLVMNTCGTNQPFYLTANHCFNGNSNTVGWRFSFQEWSPTCPNPGTNVTNVLYNGSTLRARNAASDFCLVELNTTPPANSGIHYAGWSRSATPATQATGIHHPRGDVMKISRANNAVTVGSFGGTVNQHWQANWSPQNNGAGQIVTPITEPSSSGSPLFDQNRRIIGQLHGGPSACGASQLWDFYGRFDLSWTGGGTNATRLSNWLDPSNSGVNTTNTTNVSILTDFTNSNPAITITGGVNILCNGTSIYTLTGLPANTLVNWTVSNTSLATIPSPSTGTTVVLTKVGDGVVVLTATVTSLAGCFIKSVAQNIAVGTPGTSGISYSLTGPTTICINNPQGYTVTASNSPAPLQYTWSVSAGSSIVSGGTGFNFAYVQRNTAPNGTVLVYASNACGQYAPPVGVRSYNGIGCTSGSSITISPNPTASEIINLEYHDSTTNNNAKKEAISKTFTIKIADANGKIRVQKKQLMQNNNIILHTGKLENGMYIISVFDGNEWLSNKLLIGKK